MCKANSRFLTFLAVLGLVLALFAHSALAEDTPAEGTTPTSPPPQIDIQSLTPLQNGTGNLPIINPYTNEIIDPSSYQPKEKTWWEKIYPYILDVAIGVGAALVTFAVIKLVQLRKKEEIKK